MSPRIRHVVHLQPDRVGGEERPRAACAGYEDVADTIINTLDSQDRQAQRRYLAAYSGDMNCRWAIEELGTLCCRCDLREQCDEQHADEPWKQAVNAALARRTRTVVMAETVARVEAERYAPPINPKMTPTVLPPVTPTEAARHRAELEREMP